jgi:4-hydroxyacetophenone monooxygenase
MARRAVIDSGFYDALLKDNVKLISGNIQEVDSSGFILQDGSHHDCDILVLATGFEVEDFLWPAQYIGKNGVRLEDVWASNGPRAYLGITIPAFPNLFLFYGPNSQARAGGLYSWVEIWARYIMRKIVHVIETGGSSIEVKDDVFEEYNASMDELAAITSLRLSEGGGSYHVNRHGRLMVNMPWSSETYYRLLSEFDFDCYDITHKCQDLFSSVSPGSEERSCS